MVMEAVLLVHGVELSPDVNVRIINVYMASLTRKHTEIKKGN